MDNVNNVGNRPRKGLALVLGGLVAVAVVAAAAVVGTPERAEAVGLAPFTSCRELSAWGADASEQVVRETMAFDSVGAAEGGVSTQTGSAGSDALASAPTTAASGAAVRSGEKAAQQALDETNVVVDGVDELDLVDRLGGDRVLVVAGPKLAIVDLGAAKVLASRPVPLGAQVTYDAESGRAWAVGQSGDGTGVEVSRIEVGSSSLDLVGTWRTPGALVDARRVGGQLHLVASDGFVGPTGGRVPFDGGPVPCDQVLHPAGPSDATASLIVTLPVSGELVPVHATEVVGSGQLVHVTDRAAYLATPQWSSDGTSSTAIHRFDLDTLEHTGSGSVPGSLLNDFSMSEQGDHLRVAITAGGPGRFGGPIAVEDAVPAGGPTVDTGRSAPAGTDGSPGVDFAEEPAAPPTAAPRTAETPPEALVGPTAPDTTIPDGSTTTTSEVPATTTTSTTSTSTTSTSTTSTSTTTSPSTTTTTTTPGGVTIPGPGPDDPLNKVVVLDTEGDLDVVGSTPWFGHPGERLEGIRFDGDTAYAVTFLQTDPFYVLDLASPTAPKVAGEVQLPGFSAYLHPVGEGRVVGFGPGASGRQEAKLFDVSDPSAPKVVDELVLGDDSPVAYDHHAFVALGDGRFAVPVTTWASTTTECVVPPNADFTCPPSSSGFESQVVEVEVDGSRLREVRRISVELPEAATRAIRTDDGWAVLAGQTVATVTDDGTRTATVTI